MPRYTSTEGEIRWDPPGISSHVLFQLDVLTEGRTMHIWMEGTAYKRVQGQDSRGDGFGTSEVSMLIEPVPGGECPSTAGP